MPGPSDPNKKTSGWVWFFVILVGVLVLSLVGYIIYLELTKIDQSVITVFNDEPIDWKSNEIVLNLENVVGLKTSNSIEEGTLDKPVLFYDQAKNMYCQTVCSGRNALTLDFGRNLNFKRIKILQKDCKDNLAPIRIQVFRTSSLVFEIKMTDEILKEYDIPIEKRGDKIIITSMSKLNNCLNTINIQLAIIDQPIINPPPPPPPTPPTA